MWIQLGGMIIATYLMVELNNQNALIRIYSRMVSCSFVIMMLMANYLLKQPSIIATSICHIAFYLILFKAYQDKNGTGWIFYTFVFMGLASILWVQTLFFVPLIWILMTTNVLCMSVRTLISSLLGLMIPYWFWAGYLALTGQIDHLLTHFTALSMWNEPLSFHGVSNHQLYTIAFICTLGVIGSIHFLRTSYMDKIRIRMIFETFIVIDMVALVLLLLQPQHADQLTAILIINTSPLLGHFIALTRTKVTNIVFLFISIIAIFLTAYNLWTPLVLF